MLCLSLAFFKRCLFRLIRFRCFVVFQSILLVIELLRIGSVYASLAVRFLVVLFAFGTLSFDIGFVCFCLLIPFSCFDLLFLPLPFVGLVLDAEYFRFLDY